MPLPRLLKDCPEMVEEIPEDQTFIETVIGVEFRTQLIKQSSLFKPIGFNHTH